MANPRQRRKARSGGRGAKPTAPALRRLHNKQNKAPLMKGPKALQDSWDKTKTVLQNYEALGLLSQIPLAKGLNKGKAAEEEEDLSELVSGYGQIIRDAEGNVIDIILPEEPQGAEEEDEEKEVPKVEAKTAIAKKLEVISATTNKPVIRHTSNNERDWLISMVQAYGDDTDAMARDIKRNVWQRTRGEINRMLKKAGGVPKLKAELASRGGAMEQ
ncbi:Nucleolar protein 16 [Naganishia albida]|nr:Nucleolar protein 16 [Naganishia albida]